MNRAKVAVLLTRPESVLEDYTRLVGLADASRHLDAQATTVLAPSTPSDHFFPGLNTPPWQLEGAIVGLRSQGAPNLSCVRSSSPLSDAFRAEEDGGYLRVLHHHLVPTLYTFRPGHVVWETYSPRAEMLTLHKRFPEGIPVPDYLLGKNLVHLPVARCDASATVAGAMLNAFGILLPETRQRARGHLAEVLVDLLAIQREVQAGLFGIMDGTMAGDGTGPRDISPVQKNIILASGDPVALDAVAARLMGFDPMGITWIRLAHERGLGVGNPSDIELVGDEIGGENWSFKVGRDLLSAASEALTRGPGGLARLVSQPPVVAGAARLTRLYQDGYRWRKSGKKEMKNWRMDSPWGGLFDRYLIEGHLAAGR